MTGTLHEYVCVFMILSRRLCLEREILQSCREKQDSMFNNSPPTPHPENRVVYEAMRKSNVEQTRLQMTIYRVFEKDLNDLNLVYFTY